MRRKNAYDEIVIQYDGSWTRVRVVGLYQPRENQTAS